MLTPLRLPFRRRAGRPCPWLCVHKDARSRRRGLIPANHKTGGHCACKIQRCGRPRQRSVGDKKCPALRAEKLVWFALSSHRITKVHVAPCRVTSPICSITEDGITAGVLGAKLPCPSPLYCASIKKVRAICPHLKNDRQDQKAMVLSINTKGVKISFPPTQTAGV